MNKLSTFQSYPVTLTFGQGHHMSYHFEDNAIDYLFTKVYNSDINSARDIQGQKQSKSANFHILSSSCDLDLWSRLPYGTSF